MERIGWEQFDSPDSLAEYMLKWRYDNLSGNFIVGGLFVDVIEAMEAVDNVTEPVQNIVFDAMKRRVSR